MGLYRVSLNIPEKEFRLIKKIADQEVRPLRDQIRFMLKEDLLHRGLLTEERQEDNKECKGE